MASDEKPKRGRPPVDPDATPARVHLTVSTKMYDELFHVSARTGKSIPTVIRHAVQLALKKDPGTPRL